MGKRLRITRGQKSFWNSILIQRMVIPIKKYINQQDMKQTNAAEIFRLIRRNGQLTRHELEELTQMSWGGISNITARLIAGKYIVETKLTRTLGTGRKPSCLEVNSVEHFVIGLDINFSGFQAVVMNLKNEVVSTLSERVKYTDRHDLLEGIIKFTKKALKKASGHHILGIGVAMQGQVDAEHGISIQFPYCHNWKNVPLKEILEEQFGVPVFLEHDPNCILYAEAVQAEYERAILVRADNGIGLAVMMDGEILDGPGMFEIGHMCAVPNGILCSCGKRGCLECYASQRGMEAQSGMSFEELAKQAYEKETKALKMFEDMADYLAVAVGNVAHLLNIPNILLCGDMLKYQDLFLQRFCQRVGQVLSPAMEIRVVCGDVKNAAFGAALIAVDDSIEATIVS